MGEDIVDGAVVGVVDVVEEVGLAVGGVLPKEGGDRC